VWAYTLILSLTHVARFSAGQQLAVVDWIAAAAARVGHGAQGRVRVAVPHLSPLNDYFRLAGGLRRAHLGYVPVSAGHWLDTRPEFFVLPEWEEISIRRDFPGGPQARDLDRLQSGEAGYRGVVRWSSWYLQRDLYMRLDPAFGGDLWEGSIGYTVYVRDDLLTDAGGVPAPGP
jgi:hypothetical protein